MLSIGIHSNLFAQTRDNQTIQGNIKDTYGEPIIGASILEKGTANGTVSDFEGNFTLSVNANAMLSISYIGYITQVIPVAGETSFQIRLKEDVEALEEVVVVGYATGSKRTISGAVERVKKEDMNKGVISSPMDALKGKVAGVVISQSGGDPMGTTNVRVRGTASLSGGNEPLVIIDGVFGDMTMLNAIAPSDIESVTILKDASETAQYGSRGAAGVVVVTTSKGKVGFAQMEYSGQIGLNSVFKNIKMLSAADYRSTADKLGLTYTDMKGNTNWLDAIERGTGLTQNHNLSFTSGNETSNMRASLGVIQRDGALKNSDMINYTAKLDVMQYAFNKKLKLEMGMFASERDGNIQYDMQKMFYSAAAYNPTYPTVKNSDGVWDEDLLANEIYNPLGQLEITNKYEVASINTHGKATWTILSGLNLVAFGSYTNFTTENKRYIPNDIRQGQLNGNGWAYIANTNRKDLMGNVQLNYSKNWGKHHIDALVLMEGQSYKTFTYSMQTKGYESNYFKYNNLKAGANVAWGDNTSYASDYKLSSYMARVNYMLADRYIVTANFRTDGSSKLGNGNKWGVFPSASAAWVVSEETFLKEIPTVNNLKIRVGYGVTGNQDAIDSYNSLALMEPNGTTLVDGTTTTTFAVTSNDNPDLRWEKKYTFDVGLDLSMFENRLNLTMDYYSSKTKDLLYTYTVPVPPFTYTSLLANIGEMTNNGFEISMNGDVVKTRDFSFNAGVNVSFQKNKLVSLHGTYKGQELTTSEHIAVANINAAGLTQNTGVTYLMEGQPVGVFYLPHCTGIDEDGQYILEDLDENGTVDTGDSGDRKVSGQAIPKAYMSCDFTLKYKNWNLTTQFNGAFGHKIYDGTSMTYSNMNNFPTYNILANAPSLNNGKGIYDIQISDYWLKNGDYVNFEYASLGYTFNEKQLKGTKFLKNLHLAFSVNNICTITGYKGLTPMINSANLSRQSEGTGTNGTLGVDDKRIYPLVRTFSFSASVKF
ncbi:MAG: SusC/RagA family TonB-linked outer membrane protein [Massilibacteroides sp.]|nr:SusC/RagA family TonB-linked outer membrane protein [Massilibacteroides sp.]MDD3062571.1 SusC/RagA family TonB-linked outer membrane protein [Massilibacteroides sp.]MDD4115544.1 SusC/RagA family TonB-linked outer membrane protein [Massilibacteroides sp.]MDD4659337.1 SusC/RagA family TonB-linked outer membrane protein [Massilibacteroides sp.]